MRILQYKQQINWQDPVADYKRILKLRSQNLIEIQQNPGAVPALLRHYSAGRWAEFISDWGMTYDPREVDRPEIMHRPFVLYKRQIEYVDWVYQRFINRERGLNKKFRGAGASWLDAAISVIVWLTVPNAVATLGSQKQEKVDNGEADADSLFWKVRAFIRNLPALFVPEGWEKASKAMVVANPTNGSVIRGEIGDQIGRGGRASLVFADEFAELEHPERVESSLAATSDCVLYVSTIPEVGYIGSKFHELEHQMPDEQVFVFELGQDERIWDDPSKPLEEQHWYIKKQNEVSPTVFAAQYLLTNTETATNAFIAPYLIEQANQYPKSLVDQPSDVPWRIGIDASGRGADKTVIWARKGRINLGLEEHQLVYDRMDGVRLSLIVLDLAKKLLVTGPIELVSIEYDGPGGSCADQLSYTYLAPVLCALHTGIKVADGRNYNLRAWLHRQALEYLENGLCHIPHDNIFRTQATAIQKDSKGGLLLIESKEDYRKRFTANRSALAKKAGKSPDRWDAFVLTFAPPKGEPIRSTAPATSNVMTQRGWRPLDAVIGY